MKSKEFRVYTVNEQDEVDRILAAVRAVPGVTNVMGDRATKLFVAEWTEPAEWDAIEKAILRLHYTPATTEPF